VNYFHLQPKNVQENNIKSHSFARCFMRVRNAVSHITGRKVAVGVRKKGAQEDISS